jgi:hypothetical protein
MAPRAVIEFRMRLSVSCRPQKEKNPKFKARMQSQLQRIDTVLRDESLRCGEQRRQGGGGSCAVAPVHWIASNTSGRCAPNPCHGPWPCRTAPACRQAAHAGPGGRLEAQGARGGQRRQDAFLPQGHGQEAPGAAGQVPRAQGAARDGAQARQRAQPACLRSAWGRPVWRQLRAICVGGNAWICATGLTNGCAV